MYGFAQSCLRAQGRKHQFSTFDVFLYAAPLRWTIPDVTADLDLRPGGPGARTFPLDFNGPPDLILDSLPPETWKQDIGVGDAVEDKKRYSQTDRRRQIPKSTILT